MKQEPSPVPNEDPRIAAWELIAKHHIFESCYDNDRPLIEAMLERLDVMERGAHTLGEIVDRFVTDTLRWAGMEDQIDRDDPDQQTAWEIVDAMPARLRAAERERDDALRELRRLQAKDGGAQ